MSVKEHKKGSMDQRLSGARRVAVGGGKLGGDGVAEAEADVGGKLHAAAHDGVPRGLVGFVQGLQADVLLQQAEDDAGVEVVARADGAYGLERGGGIVLGEACRAQADLSAAAGAQEVGTVELDFLFVHPVGVCQPVHVEEIFFRAAHDVRILQVFDDGRCQLDGLFLVGRAEVGVVVDDGPCRACPVQEFQHLIAQHRVQCVVGTQHHHVVLLYLGECHIQPLGGVILVEDIFCIAVLVQESQRYGRLAVGKDIDVVRRDMVLAHEAQNQVAHAVIARLADETYRDARAPQRHDSVEHRPSGHCGRGLLVAEDDVEDGFADTDYFSHNSDLDFSPR